MHVVGEAFPLLHDIWGRPMPKQRVTQLLQAMARATEHGDILITGHSLRVTGAMRMALAGLSIDLIKVFGRWANEAVMAYLRESVVHGRRALVTHQIQEGIAQLPQTLKDNTAVQ